MIRIAEPRDASALAELAERTFRDAFADANTADDIELHCRTSYSAELQAAELADPAMMTLICERDGALVAYAQLRWHAPPAAVTGSQPAEIQRFYVDRSCHGTGVAQQLMAEVRASATARGADVLWLGVWEHNPRAIAFYAKSGFRHVGEQVFVVGRDPQRDLVLSSALEISTSI